MVTDEQIVDLYFARSEEAIAETSKKYGAYIRKIAMNVLGNFEDTIECENDTYMAVWNAIPPNRPLSFPAFAGKIARNLALNKFEYNIAKKRNNKFSVVLDELEECISGKESVEDSFLEGELSQTINTFLEKLKPDQRIMFVKRYWYGEAVKDIAEDMEIGESKVKTTLFRIRGDLKKYLERRDYIV